MANALAWINAASTDVLTGLVNRWKMDEGSGTTTADDIGGKTATMAGTPNPSWITGPNGNGALLASGTGRLAAGTTSDWSFMENTGIWTVNLWFQCTDFTTSGVTTLWGTSDGANKGVFVGLFRPGPPTKIRVTVIGTVLLASYFDGAIVDNNWHMLTVISNGSNITGLLDTVQQGSPAALSGTGTGNSQYPAQFFTIGGSLPFPGALDDVRVYNVALSTPDITTLFNNGAK